MKWSPWIPRSCKELLEKCVLIMFVCGIIGIALKFLFFLLVLNFQLYEGAVLEVVFFPLWPNVCDTTFLIAGAVVLGYRALTR